MERVRFSFCVGVVAVGLSLGSTARAGGELATHRVATGLNRPVGVYAAPGDTSRLFIIEQPGIIKVLDLATETVLATPFLNIDARVSNGYMSDGEQGLLGLAFHPNYFVQGDPNQGRFFVYYTATNGFATFERFNVSANPNVADINSNLVILSFSDPFVNHNGGRIAFGPNDGYLYIAMGDSGGGNDTNQNAQNKNVLFGKMLRIDVDHSAPGDPYDIPPTNPFAAGGGRAEVYHYGLRNPWQFSFDSANGDLYIGDVGQNLREEVDYLPASAGAGKNFGWRCMEGTGCSGLSGCICFDNALVDPIHDYLQGADGRCVTGGYVYRGCAIPSLVGTYFFADYISARIWSFKVVNGQLTAFERRDIDLNPPDLGGIVNQVSAFGVDALGEIYIVDRGGAASGQVFKIVPEGPITQDCNTNSVEDACDIATGNSSDLEHDGIPDDCQGVRVLQAQGLAGQTRPFTGYVDPAAESTNGVTHNLGLNSVTMVFSEAVRDIGGTDLTASAFSLRETATSFGVDESQEPGGTGSTAYGFGSVALSADQTQLTIRVEHTLAGATVGHIHRGAPGVSGPVVFPLPSVASPINTVWNLSPADVQDLKDGLLYVNIHSAAFPAGEIRGQINPNGIVSIDATANPVVNVTLARPLSLGAWTTIQAAVENLSGVAIQNLGDLGPGMTEPDRVDVAFLPGDIDQSGVVNPVDLLRFKQYVNNVQTPSIGVVADYINIDRNATVNPLDLLRFRQLINGVHPPSTRAWSGRTLNAPRP